MKMRFSISHLAWIASVIALFLPPSHVDAQSTTMFAGVPSVKISEGGIERLPETLSRTQASNLHCVISEIGGKYFWASRENVPLFLSRSGAFLTFLAINGSGYIRVIDPAAKATVSAAYGGSEAEFDYVEHALIGLRSVTYYGKAR